MNTLTSTFEVSTLPRATEPLPVVPYYQAIDFLLSTPICHKKERLQEQIAFFERSPTGERGDTEERMKQFKKQLATIEASEATAKRSVEACSCNHGQLVAGISLHPVVAAVFLAFNDHRPLILSPDMIWLLICQGVANHVNVHTEKLRSRFVRHPGKARIKVSRDNFIKGSPENPWGEVIDEFSFLVGEHIGPALDLFVPRFSTTSAAERIAAEIVLLDAVQSYFEFEVNTICGIPAITLEGTAADWQELAERAQAFAQFDLDWWLRPLRPILQEFVAAAQGDVRRAFWESIYRFNSFSGGGALTGWIAAFFPYFKDQHGNATEKNPWLAEGGEKLKLLLAGEWDQEWFDLGGPSPGAFPSGLARAPFVWDYIGQSFNMEFLGGFVGVTQDSATLALRPEIGWAIRQIGVAI